MVIERTQTTRYEMLPEGHYQFTIIAKPEKFKAGKTHYRRWQFAYITDDNQVKKTSFIIFPWESEELLLAVGGIKQQDGSVEWDDEKVEQRRIDTDVVHEEDNKGKTRAKLRNVTETMPF